MAMKNPTKTYRLALIGVMTAILCILGPLSIPLPFSPVPLSLTNFAILLAVFLLGCCLLYTSPSPRDTR